MFHTRIRTRLIAQLFTPCVTRNIGCVAALFVLGGCAVSGPPNDNVAQNTPVQAETPANLPEMAGPEALIAYALEHHPELAAANADVEAAQADTGLAGALMDPELSIKAGEMRQSVMLQQRIPLFGKRGLAREQAEYRMEAARARRDELRLEIAERVAKQYADYAYIEAAEGVMEEQLELLTQLAEVVDVRYRSGGASQADLLRIENERNTLRNELRNLQDSANAAAAQLNAALGRQIHASIPELRSLPHQPVELDEATLRAELAEGNPGLKALEYEQLAGESGQALAQRASRPDLMLGVEYMEDEAMGGDTALMVGFNLPVWGGNYRAERDQADARYRAVQARYQNQAQQLEAKLTTALFRWREAERNRELYGDVLNTRAEQSVYAARTAYRSGDAGFTDLIDSQRQWLAFQLNYQRALADGFKWRAEIASLTGEWLTLLNEESDSNE